MGLFSAAIQELELCLGKEQVICERDRLLGMEQATFATAHLIAAAIFPSSTSEVLQCVQIAAKYRLSIYPISCGKNWGNGSRVPSENNCILMDLGRMNQILAFDENLAYVTIEPGVTQAQIVSFLRDKKSSLAVGVTGSAADSSVIGNVLERGDATGYGAERCMQVCGFEVVLPTGEVLHTGFGRFQDARCTALHSQGLGPSLDGLFVQSNLGIVTQMTLWLEPKPDMIHHVFLPLDGDDQLQKVVDVLHRLSLKRIVQNLAIWNDYKLFSRLQQYPYETMQDKVPLSLEMRLSLREKYGVEKWMVFITLFSFHEDQARAQIEILEQSLGEYAFKLQVLKDPQVDNSLGDHRQNASLAYWRKKSLPGVDLDLDANRCGLIWGMFLSPFVGAEIAEACLIADEVCERYGFEANIALIGTQMRTIKILIAIVYDRDVALEDEKAMACHDEIMRKMIAKKYFPYRLGLQSMWAMESDLDDYGKVWKKLKNLFDPEGILSPGRYSFSSIP